MAEPIALDRIRAEVSAQPRAAMLTDEVTRYGEAMVRGDVFPPLVVYFDGAAYWLADGFHRFHAALSLGLAEFDCDVREGGLRDAILHAVGANDAHGIQRTQEDKRRAIARLLNDPEWVKWSDSAIARACRVDHKTVARARALVETFYPGNSQDSAARPNTAPAPVERKVERGGTTYTMNTGNLARRVAADARPPASRDRADNRATWERPAAPLTAEPAAPVPAYFTQGDTAIFNAFYEVRRILERLPAPERAVADFPDRVRHDFTAEDLDGFARWFARAAEAWRQHEGAKHVAAE